MQTDNNIKRVAKKIPKNKQDVYKGAEKEQEQEKKT